jgi:uncharacterized protein YycO
MKVIFRCSENMNRHQEEFEFDDDATEEEIQEEFVTWVWNEVGDYYSWFKKGDEDV